jgi:hypothetical protein
LIRRLEEKIMPEYLALEGYRGVEATLHEFYTSELEWSEWLF